MHTLLFLGVTLIMQPSDSLRIEPGKQLQQSLAIRRGSGSSTSDATLHYMLFVPHDYKPDGKKWPLLLFLHGLGECGDNELERVKIHGPPKIVDSKPDFAFVVVSPQLPPPPGYDMKDPPKLSQPELLEMVRPAWRPEELIQLLDHVEQNLNIDPTRVYITGLSMGGYGTWRMVATYPERFAAALPICGGGEPESMARFARRVPIWTFHGAKDAVVPLSETERMVRAVRRARGDVKLTVYADVEHNSWAQTYDNPKVYEWLLSHRGPLKNDE
jgi:predicted peptidase